MPPRNAKLRIVARRPASRVERPPGALPPIVSGRWLLAAICLALAAAALCAWGALCLIFWQGSWQLLYHPSAVVARTPAAIGLPFDPVGFAATETGAPRLSGWWIPAAPDARFSRFTVLCLHGQDGNLGGTLDTLAELHSVGVNLLAFDYRGYGQSQFARPSQARWREDAEWALQYLTATRHIAAGAILLDGAGLGANLALEIAAAHPELAGVVLESPIEAPMDAIFRDPRARLLPAHALLRDRYALNGPSAALRIPSLWLLPLPDRKEINSLRKEPEAFQKVSAPKMLVWITPSADADKNDADELSRWLDTLPAR
jgi:hypothetical protein